MALCACVFVSTASVAQAFGEGFGGGDIGGVGDIGDIAGSVESGLSAQGMDVAALADLAKANLSDLTDLTASMISKELGEGREFCATVQRAYQIDCIADRFQALAEQLPRKGDYRDIRQGLRSASRDLNKVARSYAQPGAPKARFKAGSIRTGRLTPVNPPARAAAEAQAAAVINTLQTVLLRSGEKDRAEQVLYQEISAAVGSNKLLLRS
jgi:hypothetical protein